MIDKQKIVKAIIKELIEKMNMLVDAALDAKEAATSPEAKAENKYDTRGLEASYLAGAQAKRVEELKMQISDYQNIEIKTYSEETPIEATALLHTEVDGEEERIFFMVSQSGGMKLSIDGDEVYTLSVHSPLGQKFFRKIQGDVAEFTVAKQVKEYEIIEVN